MPLDPLHLKNCYCKSIALFCQDKESLCKIQVSGAVAMLPSQSQDSCSVNIPPLPDGGKWIKGERKELNVDAPHPVLRTTFSRTGEKDEIRSSRFTLHSSLKKRAAFTLAEVLITLGIIGVVAAITIPSIITDYQKKITAKRLSQTYSILSQALTMAQAEYGDTSSWSTLFNVDVDDFAQTTELGRLWADKYLLPYMKKLKNAEIMTLSDAGYKNNITSKSGSSLIYVGSNYYITHLSNGVILLITYEYINGKAFVPLIYVDVNGITNPNMAGRDVFLFTFRPNINKLVPYAYNYPRETLKDRCKKDNSLRASYNLYCTALIMLDGWEIKDDYPW